jgi:hypothetical protein
MSLVGFSKDEREGLCADASLADACQGVVRKDDFIRLLGLHFTHPVDDGNPINAPSVIGPS